MQSSGGRPDTIFGASFIAIAPDHPFTKFFESDKNFLNFKNEALKNIAIESSLSKNEKLGLGTIDNIEEVVAQQQLSSPAIIVIGEVVKESSKFHSFYKSVHSELLK